MKFNKVHFACFSLLAAAIALNLLAQRLWTLPGYETAAVVAAR